MNGACLLGRVARGVDGPRAHNNSEPATSSAASRAARIAGRSAQFCLGDSVNTAARGIGSSASWRAVHSPESDQPSFFFSPFQTGQNSWLASWLNCWLITTLRGLTALPVDKPVEHLRQQLTGETGKVLL